METRGDRGRGQCPDVVHVKEEPEHPPPLTCKPTIPRGNLYHSHDIHLGGSSRITAENYVERLKQPGHSRQGQEVGLVKEEPPEHSPQPGGARTLNEQINPKKIVELMYPSNGVHFGDHTYVTAESPTELHIKEEQKETSFVYDVKEEALCVDEEELHSSASHGVSAAAMLAALYTDHTVKDELLLGPELLHRPSATQSGLGDCRQSQEVGLVEEEPPEHSPQPGGARTLNEPKNPKKIVQLVYPSHGVYFGDHAYVTAESPTELHIKEEQKETSLVHDVKEEALCVDEGELQSSASHGVSAAAMMAGLYTDHIVKDELLLGPELLHRPNVTKSDPPCVAAQEPRVALALDARDHTYAVTGSAEEGGGAVSSDTGVAEALGRRCSVRLERLLLDAGVAEALGRRCSVRLERLLRCDHCDKAFRHKSVLSKHIHNHMSTRLAHSRCSTREDPNSDRDQKVHTRVKPFKCSLKGKLRGHESTHTRENPFHCKYCDYKCSRKGHLRRHEMKHTGEKPFQCNHCDYKCCQKGHLRRHEMKHTGLKPFKCNYCDYKCSLKQELRKHEMTHTGKKPFKCNYCDHKCSLKANLRIHEMTHTGVKPFHCNYCEYKSSQKEHVRRHEMTHTGVKPFKCDYCDYKCSEKGPLRRHEMTHTGVKPYHCDYCDYKCSRKAHLRRHEMTHTGVKPSTCDYKCAPRKTT